MRRITLSLFATTAVFGLTAGTATAADLPRKAPPPVVAPPPPPYNWTGFYVGGFLGAGWSRTDLSDPFVVVNGFGFIPGGGDRSFGNGVGVLGGVTLGYNWQIPGSPIVLGIEGEWAAADIKADTQRNRTRTFGDTFGCIAPGFSCTSFGVDNASVRVNSQVRDIATITGRFGLASGPQDRTLWYVKGGGAWVKTNVNVNAQANFFQCDNLGFAGLNLINCFSDSANASFNQNFTKWGWTVGTGLEFGLWGNWSGKVEYDFVSVGSRDFTRTGVTDLGDDFSVNAHVKQQVHAVKIGLNYRFGDWGLWGKSPRTY
jgi:outer membrane immunogenic protein